MGCILVIEDDPAFMYLVTLVLTDEGHQVIAAADGNEALEALDANEPDLILVDMQMPVMSGQAFIEAYRQASKQLAPVVAMSGNPVLDATVTSALVDMLVKPFDMDELVDCVKKQLAAIGHGT
jgi:CheY-like chemotaxis protein